MRAAQDAFSKTYTIERRVATGIVTHEEWCTDGLPDRDEAEGPARIVRDPTTGALIWDAWFKNGKHFEPTAEIRAAWLANSGERIAESSAPPGAWELHQAWLRERGSKQVASPSAPHP